MAAPTQQLPSWLSASDIVVDGQTETTLVYIPLTYFGPSIPLGSLFTFGGLTSPASTSITATPTTSTTSTISSVTPTSSSSTSIPSSTSLSSMSASSTLASSSVASGSPSISATPSPTTQSHGLEKGQLIGAIVAAILGAIFLVVFSLLFYLWCSARRKRRNGSQVPALDDDDYFIIPVGGVSPGEGSPRASGEEADPFLHRDSQMQQASSVAGPSTVAAVASRHPPSADNSLSSSGQASSNSGASGYGTLLQNPSLGVFVPQFEEKRGNILSPEELRQFDDVPQSRLSTVGEQGELLPLAPPPRLVDASRSQSRLSVLDRRPSLASQTSDPGEATLLTARRVRAQDLPRSIPAAESSSRRESGVWKGLGLGGLAALGRLSFLQNITGSSSSRRNSHILNRDVEAGRALLNAEPGSPPDMTEVQGPRFRGQLGLGVGYGGDRPVSGTSANSRTSTIYHDAQSSLPGTPTVMPPPRALANSSSAELGYWPQMGTETASSTTAAQGRSQHSTQSTSASTGNPTTLDVLDMPVPRAISPFASTSSVRDVGTSSSQGSKVKHDFPYPPGLTTPGVWTETAGTTPSPGSFAATSLLPPSIGNEDSGISIDVLEEEPPSPRDTWRSLAGGKTGRRTTFGLPQLVNAPEHNSEQGSLHSMRSHLSPRSTGSASASRREQSGSTGSASSRPSARSVVFGSDGSSLAHSGSISSDERRRKNRVQSPMSPSLSVFGNAHAHASPPGSASNSGHDHYPSSSFGSPLSEESADKSLAVVAEVPVVDDSSPGGRTQTFSPPQSPTLASVPWARGLDDAWSPS